MPRPELDAATEAARNALRAGGADAFQHLKRLTEDLEVAQWQRDKADTAPGRTAAAVACARLDAEMKVHTQRKQDLAAEIFALDFAFFTANFPPTGPVIVDEKTLEATIMLSGLVSHSHGRASQWLSGHTEGVETVLAAVDYMCGLNRLPSPLMGVWSLPIPDQIRALGEVANLLGADRIRRHCERSIVGKERDRDRALASLGRKDHSLTPPNRRARERAQSEQVLTTSERIIRRHLNTIAYLDQRCATTDARLVDLCS